MLVTRASAAAAMATFTSQPVGDPSLGAHAAVCILIVPDAEGQLCFVLTRRASTLRKHAGQWALPGGRLDAGETPIEAALREVEEEIGIKLGTDSVLGELDDYVTRSGFRMTPVIAWFDGAEFEPTLEPDEVASLHLVPIAEVGVEPVLLTIPESPRPVIQLPLFKSHIHAPTGAVLHQFAELILHGRTTRVSHFEQPVFAWK